MHIFAIFNGLSYVNVFTYYGGHRGLVLIINNYRMKKIYLPKIRNYHPIHD